MLCMCILTCIYVYAHAQRDVVAFMYVHVHASVIIKALRTWKGVLYQPRGSKYPMLEASGSKKHTNNGFWGQRS